jgi:hypothetical protein
MKMLGGIASSTLIERADIQRTISDYLHKSIVSDIQ